MNEPNRFVMVFIQTHRVFNPRLGLTIKHSKRATRVFTHTRKDVTPLQAAHAACVKDDHVLVEVYPLNCAVV